MGSKNRRIEIAEGYFLSLLLGFPSEYRLLKIFLHPIPRFNLFHAGSGALHVFSSFTKHINISLLSLFVCTNVFVRYHTQI